MMLVQGAWLVPTPSAPTGSGDGTYASSIWVGLDGNDPASRSLPQMGTGQYVTVTNGTPKPHLFAWWQWWDRNFPLAEQIVIKHKKFPVHAGDEIYAQIEALGPTKVSLFIKNLTTGLALPMWYGAPPSVQQNFNTIPVHVEGRTAEWIVERPGIPKTHPVRFFPLADYGLTIFTQCNAASGTPILYHDEQLQRARLIRMNVWDEAAHPGILVSSPARISVTSFGVSYVA
jgi:Peptidase A4 family